MGEIRFNKEGYSKGSLEANFSDLFENFLNKPEIHDAMVVLADDVFPKQKPENSFVGERPPFTMMAAGLKAFNDPKAADENPSNYTAAIFSVLQAVRANPQCMSDEHKHMVERIAQKTVNLAQYAIQQEAPDAQNQTFVRKIVRKAEDDFQMMPQLPLEEKLWDIFEDKVSKQALQDVANRLFPNGEMGHPKGYPLNASTLYSFAFGQTFANNVGSLDKAFNASTAILAAYARAKQSDGGGLSDIELKGLEGVAKKIAATVSRAENSDMKTEMSSCLDRLNIDFGRTK